MVGKMAVISKKDTETVSLNQKFYKNIYKRYSKIADSLKRSLAWIFRVGKNLGHLLFYHKTEPNDETAKEALLKHKKKTDTANPNYRIPLIIR